MNIRNFAIILVLLFSSGVARAECPGCVGWEAECGFTCNSQGYSITVIRPPIEGTSRYRIVVVRTSIHEFGNQSDVMGTFGTMHPISTGNVTLYAENQSPATEPQVCNRQRQMLTGRIYEWYRTNTYQFDSGETGELHDSAVCSDASIAYLRNIYLSYSGESLPSCTDVGCSAPWQSSIPKPDDLGGCGTNADNSARPCPDILGEDIDPRGGTLGPVQPQPVRPFLNDEPLTIVRPSPVETDSPAVAPVRSTDEVAPLQDSIPQRLQRLFRPGQRIGDEVDPDTENEQDDAEGQE